MKLNKVMIWASLTLTVVGLIASFMTLAAGAGHGDKSLVLFIFPWSALALAISGFVMGVVAACLQFPLYALVFYIASKRGRRWLAAVGILLAHFGIVFWILRSFGADSR